MTCGEGHLSLRGMIATDERQLEADLEHVEINSVRLAYVQRGTGVPVVFVHGGISDLTIWGPILEPVSRRFRAIAYSRRYAWPNEPIPDGKADTIAEHARDLATLIETLELGPTNLVGNSWGGFICLVVARDRPDLVRRLVVQEPPVVPLFLGAPPSPPALLKTLITRPTTGRALAGMIFNGMQPTQAALKRGAVQESIEIFARRVALGDAGYEELPGWVKRHMTLNAGTHVSQFRNDGGFVPFTARDARSIRVPTLVMTGQQSPSGLRALAKELARLLPKAVEVEIPNASHVMHVANPEATIAATVGFLNR
jgi:pimeloyl-ACP methyl ester carboxylesterase